MTVFGDLNIEFQLILAISVFMSGLSITDRSKAVFLMWSMLAVLVSEFW